MKWSWRLARWARRVLPDLEVATARPELQVPTVKRVRTERPEPRAPPHRMARMGRPVHPVLLVPMDLRGLSDGRPSSPSNSLGMRSISRLLIGVPPMITGSLTRRSPASSGGTLVEGRLMSRIARRPSTSRGVKANADYRATVAEAAARHKAVVAMVRQARLERRVLQVQLVEVAVGLLRSTTKIQIPATTMFSSMEIVGGSPTRVPSTPGSLMKTVDNG